MEFDQKYLIAYLSLRPQASQVIVLIFNFEQNWISWKWLDSSLSESFSFSQSYSDISSHGRPNFRSSKVLNFRFEFLKCCFDIEDIFLVMAEKRNNSWLRNGMEMLTETKQLTLKASTSYPVTPFYFHDPLKVLSFPKTNKNWPMKWRKSICPNSIWCIPLLKKKK